MDKENLGLAFVGCGRVADWQATFFEKGINGVKVVVACDLIEEKARSMGGRLNVDWSVNLKNVLMREDVQVVSIMTESGNHYDHAKMAIMAGKHVIVEKPPCMFAEQVLELKQLALEKGVMYAPIFQNRFNPAMKVLKEAFDMGRFGKLVCVAVRLFWCRYQDYYEDGWHGTWNMDGGVINQQAIHHVDAMHWVCGAVKQVVAMQDNRLNDLEAEDTTVAIVKFESGALGTIEVTTAARPKDMDASLTVIGEKGTVSIGGVALNEVTKWEFIETDSADAEIPKKYSVEVPNGYGYSHGPLLQEIIERIASGSIEPPISADSVAETVRLIHSVYRSAEDGRTVELNSNLRSRRLGRDVAMNGNGNGKNF